MASTSAIVPAARYRPREVPGRKERVRGCGVSKTSPRHGTASGATCGAQHLASSTLSLRPPGRSYFSQDQPVAASRSSASRTRPGSAAGRHFDPRRPGTARGASVAQLLIVEQQWHRLEEDTAGSPGGCTSTPKRASPQKTSSAAARLGSPATFTAMARRSACFCSSPEPGRPRGGRPLDRQVMSAGAGRAPHPASPGRRRSVRRTLQLELRGQQPQGRAARHHPSAPEQLPPAYA